MNFIRFYARFGNVEIRKMSIPTSPAFNHHVATMKFATIPPPDDFKMPPDHIEVTPFQFYQLEKLMVSRERWQMHPYYDSKFFYLDNAIKCGNHSAILDLAENNGIKMKGNK